MPVTYRTLLRDGVLVSASWHDHNRRFTYLQCIHRRLESGTLLLHPGALAAFEAEYKAVYAGVCRLLPECEER
jgi:hypothetical protein